MLDVGGVHRNFIDTHIHIINNILYFNGHKVSFKSNVVPAVCNFGRSDSHWNESVLLSK